MFVFTQGHLPTILSVTILPTETATVVHSVPTQGQKQAKCQAFPCCWLYFQNKTQTNRKPFLSTKFTLTTQSALNNLQNVSLQPLWCELFAERRTVHVLRSQALADCKLSCSLCSKSMSTNVRTTRHHPDSGTHTLHQRASKALLDKQRLSL